MGRLDREQRSDGFGSIFNDLGVFEERVNTAASVLADASEVGQGLDIEVFQAGVQGFHWQLE